MLVEEFNRAPLNKNLWTEVVTSNIAKSDHFKIRKILDGKYLLHQPEPKDMGTGIMSNLTFLKGHNLTYEFIVYEKSGTWSVGIELNRPGNASLLFLAGNWGGRKVGVDDSVGKYTVTVEFKDRYCLATIEGPRGNKHRRAIHNKKEPFFFTIGGRTGHDGTLKVAFDNIMVGKAEEKGK